MIKIKIISCYFGKLPDWFDLWALSCSYNPQFEFLLVTDQEMKKKTAPNITIKTMTFEALRERFQRNFSFSIALKNPRKLCDYKPVFGLAFQEELKGFDFWGHCDLDMIFGNLKKFLPDALLEQYDRIGTYGAFILYRNIDRMNYLFQKKGGCFDWKKVYTMEENCIFDEMPGLNRIAEQQGVSWYRKLEIADLSRYYTRMRMSGEPEIFVWEKGKTKRYGVKEHQIKASEVMYIHFSRKKPLNLISADRPDAFLLRSDSMQEITAAITKEFVLKKTEFISAAEDGRQKKEERKKRRSELLGYTWKEKRIWLKVQYYIKVKGKCIGKRNAG